MKLSIWTCLLCFVCGTAAGMFFELPGNTAASADDGNNDDFVGEAIDGLTQYFGGSVDSSRLKQRQGNSSPGSTTTATDTKKKALGFLDDMETSLEHATDMLDLLWHQFKNGVLNLMGNFNVNETNDKKEANQNIGTPSGNLQTIEITTNQLVSKPTSTTVMPITTATTTATTTAATTVRPATEVEPPLP